MKCTETMVFSNLIIIIRNVLAEFHFNIKISTKVLYQYASSLMCQQTACLVVNPMMAGDFAFLFDCTQVGRTTDSMTVPIKRLIY